MAYEESTKWVSGTITSYPEPVRAEPTVTGALRNLAAATEQLARAAETFIAARDDLNKAREAHQIAADIVAKEREQAGV